MGRSFRKNEGHVHFISLFVLILAVIGAVQVVHWYREHTLWQNSLATFQELNQQVRVLLEKAGYLEDYDRSMASLIQSVRDNPRALESMEQVIEVLVEALKKDNARLSQGGEGKSQLPLPSLVLRKGLAEASWLTRGLTMVSSSYPGYGTLRCSASFRQLPSVVKQSLRGGDSAAGTTSPDNIPDAALTCLRAEITPLC